VIPPAQKLTKHSLNLSGYQREKVPGAGADGQGAKVAFWFWPCAACGWF